MNEREKVGVTVHTVDLSLPMLHVTPKRLPNCPGNHRLQISRRGAGGGPSDLSLARWLRCATANVEMGAATCRRHNHRSPRVLGPAAAEI